MFSDFDMTTTPRTTRMPSAVFTFGEVPFTTPTPPTPEETTKNPEFEGLCKKVNFLCFTLQT